MAKSKPVKQIPNFHIPYPASGAAIQPLCAKPAFDEISALSISNMLHTNVVAYLPKLDADETAFQLKANLLVKPKLRHAVDAPVREIVVEEKPLQSHANSISPPFEANVCRAKLAAFISDGVSDPRVSALINSGGYFYPIECEIIDYKEQLPDDPISTGKTVKHIVAMHNTFGGYLIFGIAETIAEVEFQTVGCGGAVLDIKKIKDKIYSYTGVHLNLSCWTERVNEKTLVGLYVPKRSDSEPVYFGKDGPQDAKNRAVFNKDVFYMRRGDNTEPAAGGNVSFLFGSRDCFYSLSALDKPVVGEKFTENNLPDRNFICPRFVGRAAVLERLWFWFADQFSYVKVLAGEGGLGKTSIAYEFAQQVCEEAPIGIQRVLWLTAKTRQFAAGIDTFVPVPWTHFDSYATLLECLCRESAVSPSEIEGANERLMKSFLKDALAHIPTFIIIDDMDSLTAEDQKRGLELATQLASTKSRFLLTTRRNLTYSSDIAIELEGLVGREYSDYLGLLQERYDGPSISERDLECLHLTTHGSPLFTDSLYRLVRRGNTVRKAAEEWRGKKGAQARAAALLVEIDSLSDESKRVLLAVAILRSCSRKELSQACKYVDEILIECLEELSSFYLISAPRIRNEPRYEVLETMYSLVLQIKDRLVVNAEKFEHEVRELKKNGVLGKGINETSVVGHAISESSAFLRDGEVTEALEIIAVAQRRSKFHPDLYLMQGNCLMRCTPPRVSEARKVFRRAFDGGVRKPLLFDLWFQAELDENHAVGALSVCDLAIAEDLSRNGSWERNKLIALTRIAKDQERAGDLEAALKGFDGAAQFGYDSLSKMPQQAQGAIKETLFDLNETTIRCAKRQALSIIHSLDAVNYVIRMTERKDFRRRTLNTLVDFLERAHSVRNSHSKYSGEIDRLKDQAKLDVINVLRKTAKFRIADGDYIDDLCTQVEHA